MIFLQWEQMVGLKQPPKSQTRRPVKEGEIPRLFELVARQIMEVRIIDPSSWQPLPPTYLWTSNAIAPQISRLKWAIGRTYAVQRPDKKTVGRTPPIKAIRRERLGDISTADVFAEGLGIYSVSDGNWYPVTALDVAQEMYAQLWNSIYGPGAWERMMDDDVWVLDFGLMEVPHG